jgi:hypothetical protein
MIKPEEKKAVVYNYHRSGKVYTTPNAEIAIARMNGEEPIQVETHIGADVVHSVLAID